MGNGQQPQQQAGMNFQADGVTGEPQIGDIQGGGEVPQEDMSPVGEEPQETMGGESQYDTNFDAGVEADEDTDPEKYIQQLTGKLSTTLNSFNSENGDDSGLNKYVAKMIVKAATKNMDDATKKEIIKAINTSSKPEVDGDEKQNAQPDENSETENQEEPLQEKILTKAELTKIANKRKK